MAKELKIERNVPIPQARTRAGYQSQLRQMKPGDSVLFPLTDKATTVRKRASQAFGSGKYAVRTMPDGVRVWRLK